MNNFDLKSFLTENKLTTASKLVSEIDFSKPLPDLGKPLMDIGQEIEGKLKGAGFSTKVYVNQNIPFDIIDQLQTKGDAKLAAINFDTHDSANGVVKLTIVVHQNNQDDLKKIVDSYKFSKENGGFKGTYSSGDLVSAQIFATEKKD